MCTLTKGSTRRKIRWNVTPFTAHIVSSIPPLFSSTANSYFGITQHHHHHLRFFSVHLNLSRIYSAYWYRYYDNDYGVDAISLLFYVSIRNLILKTNNISSVYRKFIPIYMHTCEWDLKKKKKIRYEEVYMDL